MPGLRVAHGAIAHGPSPETELEGFTYQLYSPIGLDLKLVKPALNDALGASESGYLGDENCPRSIPAVGCFPGSASPALGPAL